MAVITMRQMLEAGVHFGHPRKNWNPKMARYIYSSRNDIHVIDLHKTIPLIEHAYEFIKKTVADGGTVLFVGTKKQAQEAIELEAKRCGMFFISQRWLGGTLTNFKTLRKNISRMKEIEKMEANGTFEKLPKKEVSNIKKEKAKLDKTLGGIREMTAPPTVIFIVDTQKEMIAVKEAKKLGIPIVGVVDTNCDPDDINYVMAANDDAIRSVKLLCSVIADAVLEGRRIAHPGEVFEIPEGTDAAPEVIAAAAEIEKEEEIQELGMDDFLEPTDEEAKK